MTQSVAKPPSDYSNIINQSTWMTDCSHAPAEWQPWLEDQGSLTSALMEYSERHFRVNVLTEYWGKPLAWEADKLQIPANLDARIREVELLCYEQVMVFARSIIPISMFEAESDTFAELGSKPLGHLLFKDGRARNRQRSFSLFVGQEHTPQIANPVYGRSTPYEYHGGEILVSEFFVNPSLVEPS